MIENGNSVATVGDSSDGGSDIAHHKDVEVVDEALPTNEISLEIDLVGKLVGNVTVDDLPTNIVGVVWVERYISNGHTYRRRRCRISESGRTRKRYIKYLGKAPYEKTIQESSPLMGDYTGVHG